MAGQKQGGKQGTDSHSPIIAAARVTESVGPRMPVRSDRLDSLDAFRGLTIAAMILVNNPGSWAHVYPPLRHAEWHGCTPTDLIFPFFLFIVGVAMTFSLGRRLEEGERRRVVGKVVRRALIIFALGLLLSAFPEFRLSELRVAGVLQRIAVVYLVASLLVLRLSRRALAWTTAGLLAGYWAALELIPVPGQGAGVLTPEGNLAAWVDGWLLPGRMYQGTWDPEGLASTVPAVATTLLGVFTGHWIRSRRERSEIAAGMFTAGWLAILAGLAWSIWFPLNKNLWTSSYVLFTAGAALEGLAFCYWLIDGLGYRAWARPAIVFGLNAIAVYVLSGLGTDLLIWIRVGMEDSALYGWIYRHLFVSWAGPLNGSLAFALAYLAFWWLAMAALYRRRIFIKV